MTVRLQELMDAARSTAERDRQRLPETELRARVRARGASRPGRLREALRGREVTVVAECKGASPVDGALRPEMDPVALALEYRSCGAAAISVLTEETRFAGSLDHLRAVAEAVDLPTLRKDFVSERYQLLQAADAGAAGVLLIADALEPERLCDLAQEAHDLGLDALVEIHDARSLEAALATGSGLIGVNNRDLVTMRVNPEHALSLAAELPADWVKVAESGIACREQVVAAAEAGFHAVLVGSSLVTAADPGAALRALLGREG